MANDDVDLDRERQRTDDLFQSMMFAHVPLAVAAAITFHQVHGNTRAIVTRQDYDDALNIAAAALSRLIAIYAMGDDHAGRVAISIDLTRQHFARGATELRNTDGSRRGELSLLRGELLSAISLIRRAGLPFAFALPSTTAEVLAPDRQKEKPLTKSD
jgi:hypothetical protein